MKNRLEFEKIIPVLVLVFMLAIFGALTEGRTLSLFNLRMLFDQTVILLIGCCGGVFVSALGCVNLSTGVVLAFSAVIGDLVYQATGSTLLMVITIIAIGAGFGALIGFLNAKCKIPSFMCTLAMLIGLRGIVNYIQSVCGLHPASPELLMLQKQYIQIPLVILIVIVLWFIFEKTKFGRQCQAIGENEVVAGYSGVPVVRTKILAFVTAGVATALTAIFTVARLGATSATMGVNFEIRVLMGIYVGGVLVRGGATAKIYKVIIGAFVVSIIENGLKIMGYASTEINQLVMGILLMLVLFLNISAESMNTKKRRKQAE